MDKLRPSTRSSRFQQVGLLCVASLIVVFYEASVILNSRSQLSLPPHAAASLARCQHLNTPAGPPKNFHDRKESDRFVPGTKPILITNGKIWTGADNGTEVVHGDILIDKGMIMAVGNLDVPFREKYGDDVEVINAHDSWVTPSIIDIHSHLGDDPSPELDGAQDYNSRKGTIDPWLRSLDGLNTHDDAYPLSIAGGVTTALVLPGSANAIGGQAFVIKLRKTAERSPSSMVLEAPYQVNTSFPDLPPRWRHMKQACGENPSGWNGDTRMDTIWAFRKAYDQARQVKKRQDDYCAKALAGQWHDLGPFPEDLQWEALVDVLRGRVKINTHCYEAVDLDDLIRLTNEFRFPVSAVHHASEAYLVPQVLKRAYGSPPAVAVFAGNARYKREAYRFSEFAPRILAENGLTVIMKSDHPVQDSRFLLFEAQQAFYYGLPENLALASVTTNPARTMGMDHRIGFVKKGWDADLVIWDSHPLALGATPKQVLIDGIPQLSSPHVVKKPGAFQSVPSVPNFDKEARQAVEYEGLPPLTPSKPPSDTVVFTNLTSLYNRTADAVLNAFSVVDEERNVVVVHKGKIVCSGTYSLCITGAEFNEPPTFVDLEGGSISPGLVSFGSPLGLDHIEQEESTNDGYVFDPLTTSVPKILGAETSIIRAIDGLQFSSRDALLAYRAGVTSAVTAPSHLGFLSGLGTSFSTGAAHKLQRGSINKEVTGLHVSVRHFGKPSVSTQIAVLRKMLLGSADEGEAGQWWKKTREGRIPLVIEAHSADIIATLILLKKEVELVKGSTMRLTITGATESHLVAKEIAEANVGIVLTPSRPFPHRWEQRRILAGPPLSEETIIAKLIAHKVTVGIGIEERWQAQNERFDLAWAALAADGKVGKEDALALGSVNLEKLLGAEVPAEEADLVATAGGDLLDMNSKVVAIIRPRTETVDMLI